MSSRIVLAVILLALLPAGALAQAYPTKPVRILVGFLPGGGSDIFGRLIAQSLTERLGQQVVVENRPGAGATIATEAVVRSAPDGYTLLLGSSSEIAMNPELYTKLTFDPRKDLVPVSLYATTPLLLVVHPSLPVKNVKEMIALAKARPGEMNYGSAGSGSMTHLAAALFVSGAGTKIVHVPYKGVGAVVPDLIAGQVQMMTVPIPPVLPLVQAGRLKALGVTTLTRSKMLPDLPTIDESGLKGYDVIALVRPVRARRDAARHREPPPQRARAGAPLAGNRGEDRKAGRRPGEYDARAARAVHEGRDGEVVESGESVGRESGIVDHRVGLTRFDPPRCTRHVSSISEAPRDRSRYRGPAPAARSTMPPLWRIGSRASSVRSAFSLMSYSSSAGNGSSARGESGSAASRCSVAASRIAVPNMCGITLTWLALAMAAIFRNSVKPPQTHTSGWMMSSARSWIMRRNAQRPRNCSAPEMRTFSARRISM